MIPPHFNVVVVVAVVVFNLLLLMLLISILAQTFLGVVVCFYDVTVSCQDSPFYPSTPSLPPFHPLLVYSSISFRVHISHPSKSFTSFLFHRHAGWFGFILRAPYYRMPHLHPRFCFFYCIETSSKEPLKILQK